MGYNNDGQLGDGQYSNTNQPVQIVSSGVTAIAGGSSFSLFIKSDGSLWGVGQDYYGQLGDGYFTTSSPFGTNQPKQIVASGVAAVSAGYGHTLFVMTNGSLWAMGNNQSGQLGDGTTIASAPFGVNIPEQIVASKVIAIAAGEQHSLFIKNDGSLWGMGANNLGQLGDGTTANVNLPEQIVANNVTAIAVGYRHSLFLKGDGSLWGMGGNAYGVLGTGLLGTGGTTYTNRPMQIVASNVVAIAAANHHSLFLKKDGSLWAMGTSDYGQLGDGAYRSTAVDIKQIVGSGVTMIAAGELHSLFLKSDGSLWGMGRNQQGQLGDGSYNDTNRPEQIVVNPSYNKISNQLLGSGKMRLTFVGIAGANYALDYSYSLSPPNWLPQTTNLANTNGLLIFTNTPNPATNNFWRIRSVP